MQLFHSMSMAFPFWPLLCLLLTSFAWAGPLSTGSLTPTLQQLIPICAQTCLEFFVAENFPFPTCGPPPNFDCLCTSYSTSGLTVGEGALECLYLNCPDFNEAEALSVYDVCMTVSNAKLNTHDTLTATISPTVSATGSSPAIQATSTIGITATASPSPISSLTSAAASSTYLSVNPVITTASTPPFPLSASPTDYPPLTDAPTVSRVPSTAPTGTSSSSTASKTAVASSSSVPLLTKPQVAGVVVVAIGVTAIAFGLCYLIVCLRRRRKPERPYSGSSFGGDKIIDSEETTPDMSAIAARDFGHEQQLRQQNLHQQEPSPTRHLRLETPVSPIEDGWVHSQRIIGATEARVEARPQIPRSLGDDYSPITPSSNRTRNSQLLPDKPTYSLFPPPLRVTPRNSTPKLRPTGTPSPKPAVPPLGSPFARALPPHPGAVDTSQAHLQNGSSASPSNSDPFTGPCNKSRPSVYHQFQESGPSQPHPSIRRVPPSFRIPSWEQPHAAGIVRKPLPFDQSSRARDTIITPSSSEPPYMSSIASFHSRKPSRRKTNGSRPMTHFSNGSETSFETLDDEDESSRDPRSALSPVAEVRSPPTGSITVIPVSAAESPTQRAQERPVIPARPATLLSKRLGQEKANEIADRLHGSPQHSMNDNSQRSPKRKNLVSPDRKSTENPRSPFLAKGVLKSPAGQTPWRR